ncbi:MAG: glycosyltransferase [Hyphomonadaceae bacterium]
MRPPEAVPDATRPGRIRPHLRVVANDNHQGVMGNASQKAPTADVAVFANAAWSIARPAISVVIPCYRGDVDDLLLRLAGCIHGDEIEVVVYDDGTNDPEAEALRTAIARPLHLAVLLAFARGNIGRARARNAAAAYARAPWVLFLDADMLPDDDRFIARYLDAAKAAKSPCVIVGGYSLAQSPVDPRFALHRRQALTSECLPAIERNRSAGRHVYTSNVLVHADALKACPFPDDFAGWGWEDTDWGLRLANRFPIIHIDNTASHLGLDDDRSLMAKYAEGADNFARLVKRHPAAMEHAPLLRAARIARFAPFRRPLAALLGHLTRQRAFPAAARLTLLKLWRALIYAEAV